MERSELIVFGISIRGIHPDFIQKRYYGVALDMNQAVELVKEKAIEDGWTEIRYNEVSEIGDVSFAPWNSIEYEENESEVEKC